jgi:hypothetical protein
MTTAPRYSYTITPRPEELGGGGRLRRLDGEEEEGGGVLPMRQADPAEAAEWWESLPIKEQEYWLTMGNDMPMGAYHSYCLAEDYAAAEAMGEDWLQSRPT